LSPLERAYLDASIAYAPSVGRRIIAASVDLIVVFCLVIIEASLLGEHSPLKEGTTLYPWSFYAFILAQFMGLRVLGYKLGGSPGMRIADLVLIARDGKPVTWRQAFIRALLFWLPYHSRFSGTVLLRKTIAVLG
jgi:uncharacterized RDD family membrane protein YckC